MQHIVPATPAELAQYRTADRISDRWVNNARTTAAADPVRVYRCRTCDTVASPMHVALHGRTCDVSDHHGELCGGELAPERVKNIPIPLVERRAPVAQ